MVWKTGPYWHPRLTFALLLSVEQKTYSSQDNFLCICIYEYFGSLRRRHWLSRQRLGHGAAPEGPQGMSAKLIYDGMVAKLQLMSALDIGCSSNSVCDWALAH